MGTLQTFLLYQMVLVSSLLNKSLRNQHNSSNLFFDLKKKKKKKAELYSCSKRSNFRNYMKNSAFVMNLYHSWHSATMAIGGRTTLWSRQTQKKDCETRTQRQTNRVTCQKKKIMRMENMVSIFKTLVLWQGSSSKPKFHFTLPFINFTWTPPSLRQ